MALGGPSEDSYRPSPESDQFFNTVRSSDRQGIKQFPQCGQRLLR